MWGIGATAVMVAALLAPPSPTPDLPEPLPGPEQGCVLPLASSLLPCAPDGRDRSPAGCVVPLADPLRDPWPSVPEQDCAGPGPDRTPRLEILPLSR